MALAALLWLLQRPIRQVPASRLTPQHRLFCTVALLSMPPLAALAWSIPIYLPRSFRDFAVGCVTTLGLFQFLGVSIYAGLYKKLAGLWRLELR